MPVEEVANHSKGTVLYLSEAQLRTFRGIHNELGSVSPQKK